MTIDIAMISSCACLTLILSRQPPNIGSANVISTATRAIATTTSTSVRPAARGRPRWVQRDSGTMVR